MEPAWLESNGCPWRFWMLPPSSMFGDWGIIKSLANIFKNSRTSRVEHIGGPKLGRLGRETAETV